MHGSEFQAWEVQSGFQNIGIMTSVSSPFITTQYSLSLESQSYIKAFDVM
jgi:hypothetical protein